MIFIRYNKHSKTYEFLVDIGRPQKSYDADHAALSISGLGSDRRESDSQLEGT